MRVYLYDGRKQQRALEPAASRLGEELLRANGHSASAAIDLARYRMPQDLSPPLPNGCGGIDMRAFVERVRALATQI